MRIVIELVDAAEMTESEQASLLSVMLADAESKGGLRLSTHNYFAAVKVTDTED